jgi:hypothetical protein
MLTITVNGKEITISDIMAGMICKHYNDRYSLKIGFETNTVLSEYEKECVGRKLVGLATENEQLKERNLYLSANLKLADDPCTGTCSTCGGQLREGYTFCPYCGEFAKDGE